jgi:DNA polymerase-3 subunit epsilon
MRQIIIDTETTGLDPKQGHRIIELAALEIIDRRTTGRAVQFRLDPEREIDAGATEVHGMTWEDLKGKPKFSDVIAEFVDFTRGADWVIHNAPFDVGFLDAELRLAAFGDCTGIHANLIDTLALAREMFGIDNAHRSVHGALLDAQLLAEVYLAMTRGQETLVIDMGAPSAPASARDASGPVGGSARPHDVVTVIAPTPAEFAAHEDYLAALDKESKGRCLWLALASAPERAAA